jgi:ribosomal-protein-alanine N-acetyltransferase
MVRPIIRSMREDDIPAIMEIEKVSFATPWPGQSFIEEICKKYAFSKVAVLEERVIGYACADYALYESRILKLAVHQDFRRRGVATMLMNKMMTELRNKGCVFMYLKVRASNTGAQRFYELFGFKTETVRKKYYDDPAEEALLMMGRISRS